MEKQKIDIHIRGSMENASHKFLYEKITNRDRNRFYSAADYLAETVRFWEKTEHILCINLSSLSDEDYQAIVAIMKKQRGENENLTFR